MKKHPPPKRRTIEIYTDGSARPNPGRGRCGFRILEKDTELASAVITTGDDIVTNNHMEILAVITALETAASLCDPEQDFIYLYTDSMYVQQGITTWVHGWIKKGWKTSNGSPVVNQELWERLLSISNAYRNLHFSWVRGHNGNVHNEFVDNMISQ